MKQPPQIKLNIINKIPEIGKFLKPRTIEFTCEYENGDISKSTIYELIADKADAAVITPVYYDNNDKKSCIILRSSIRPPVYERFGPKFGNQWELPAGLIDKGETPAEAAARELLEEAGFDLSPKDMIPLDWGFPSVGTHAERLFFFGCFVDWDKRKEAETDGSPLENGAELYKITFDDFYEALFEGQIHDLKTEIGVRRFKTWLSKNRSEFLIKNINDKEKK